MIEWKQLRQNPYLRRGGVLLLCMLTACLLSLARFGGLALPLNAALAAALSPAGGIAVLAGSAAADFLTGTLQKHFAYSQSYVPPYVIYVKYCLLKE